MAQDGLLSAKSVLFADVFMEDEADAVLPKRHSTHSFGLVEL